MVHFEGLKISSTLGMNIYLKRRTEEGGQRLQGPEAGGNLAGEVVP
jgi:hypothetical protein